METKRIERGIRQFPDGRYQVRVHVNRDPLTGKSRQVSRNTSGGIKAARALRSRLETEVRDGKHGGTKATVAHLFDAWNAHREKHGASPNTLGEDRRKIAKDIVPVIGAKPLAKLEPKNLDDLYGNLLAGTPTRKALSEQTVLHVHRIIHAALEQAVMWEWIPRNVADSVKPPTPRPREATVPVPAEVQALIAEAGKSRNAEYAGMFTVAALSGLRPGELCALRVCDVNWTDDSITPRKSVWQREGKRGVKLQKSRMVKPAPLPIDPLATAVLRYRWNELEVAAAAAGRPLSSKAFVWSRDPLGTVPYTPGTVGQAFRRIRKRVGVTGRLYDLRHFAATEMIARGVDIRTVAERMRHADPAFTMRTYVTGRPEQSRLAAAALGASLTPTAKPLVSASISAPQTEPLDPGTGGIDKNGDRDDE